MSIDFNKIQLSSNASSLKVLLQGSGSFAVPALAAAGNVVGSATIPHGFSSDNLLFQVATNGASTSGTILPWESNDGRNLQYARLDAINLYIYCISNDGSGLGAPGFTITYFYRILIP